MAIKTREYFTVFSFGGIIYGLIEVFFRGYTHWTMVLTGGIAFLLIYFINIKMRNESLFLRCLAGCILITAIEFAVGCVVNRGLHMNVWDYSDEQFNLLGQICPLFSLAWFVICIPASLLAFLLESQLRLGRRK